MLKSSRGLVASMVAIALAALVWAPAASAQGPEPGEYQADDAGGFRNILPPGQNGSSSLAEILRFVSTGARPEHNSDQLGMYEDLVYAYDDPNFDDAALNDFYKDASFGVPPSDADAYDEAISPRDDVTIIRDSEFGVPHIYGETRAGAMFGTGYATAQDRLFFIDVLRHSGRGQLSSFVGGSEGNREMDRGVWRDTPYTEEDLQLQIDRAPELYGEAGEQIVEDLDNYVAGINAYIDENRLAGTLPGEYQLTNNVGGPEEFKPTDVIAIGALVAGIFGKGGGNELGSAEVLQAAQAKFGKRAGRKVWADFRSQNDAEAPTTTNERFPYQRAVKNPIGTALPDPGTLERPDVVASSTPMQATPEGSRFPDAADLLGPLDEQSGMSNALLVSGRESESGNPLAVMGPQVSYYAPQILIEQDVHAPDSADGPGIDARGSAFPGTNLYVQLGRGTDYAWSATSAGQDITDTYAMKLCNPDGQGEPSLQSEGYLRDGECKPFETLERTNTWTPSAADQTPAGSETLRSQRTELGIVSGRSLIKGVPYVFTTLRATYFHEVDPSVLGFADFNNPDKMESAKEFMKAANKVDLTFNWFYVNDDEIAYFNSGANPVRPKRVDPNFPVFGRDRFVWRDLNTELNTSAQAPQDAHPHDVDKAYLTSWNNKQAKGFSASDDTFAYGSVYRSDSLDERIERGIAGSKKMNLVELVQAMEDAGTVDLRGSQVLPWALRVLRSGRGGISAEARPAVATLKAWAASGAHRRDADGDGTYEQADAVRIMDAWWPLLVEAQFKPALGDGLMDRIKAVRSIDDSPHKSGTNQGSAYNGGWYAYSQKDLRSVLRTKVRDPYSRKYCGRGSLKLCKKRLQRSLVQAAAIPYEDVYADADDCEGGDPQWCYDAVESRALGAITQPEIHWINRPTFQQIVEVGTNP
ncbi:penicillin acylase family protein [Thermoleophilia bacterium SCSIO 60948]|nr:penicillin acylase family protein [Thermoleophilia bacterium SCSIO 60948]